MAHSEALFHVGQMVTHLKWGYRGIVFDVDPVFSETDEWYEATARSRPPRNKPWYHVLVDGQEHTTYVAERHLAADDSLAPIRHPLIDALFSTDGEGRYIRRITHN
tara:strand:- start:493 stop:810 length:318 start_codon:yes stop_codon:yes gene_type:complete